MTVKDFTVERQELVRVNLLVLGGTVLVQFDDDLDTFIDVLDRADSFGPFIDPTGWQKSQKARERLRRMAIATRTFRRECAALQKEADEMLFPAAGEPPA